MNVSGIRSIIHNYYKLGKISRISDNSNTKTELFKTDFWNQKSKYKKGYSF